MTTADLPSLTPLLPVPHRASFVSTGEVLKPTVLLSLLPNMWRTLTQSPEVAGPVSGIRPRHSEGNILEESWKGFM